MSQPASRYSAHSTGAVWTWQSLTSSSLSCCRCVWEAGGGGEWLAREAARRLVLDPTSLSLPIQALVLLLLLSTVHCCPAPLSSYRMSAHTATTTPTCITTAPTHSYHHQINNRPCRQVFAPSMQSAGQPWSRHSGGPPSTHCLTTLW